jgi:hypothetical protein
VGVSRINPGLISVFDEPPSEPLRRAQQTSPEVAWGADKHDLVSAYCIRDLNQDHGLSAHSPQSPKISSADHMLTR